MKLSPWVENVASLAIAAGMTLALLWFVTGTFLLNLTVLGVVVLVFLFAVVSKWITRDLARRRAIRANWGWFVVVGFFLNIVTAIVAARTGHWRDLTHDGFGLLTFPFIAGLAIAYLPRAAWRDDRLDSKRASRRPPES